MSALSVFVTKDRAHLVTDGAGYNADNQLLGLVQKVTMAPHLGLAMGFRGHTDCGRVAAALLMNMPATVDPGEHFAECLRLRFEEVGEDLEVVIAGMRGRTPFAILISSYGRPEHKPFEPLEITAAWGSPPVAPEIMDAVLSQIDLMPTAAARTLLEAQRDSADCPIGGYGQLVTLSPEGAMTRCVARWDDVPVA